jgi:putative ABC transport system permease protein
VIGLVSLSVLQRRKEIGVRKVLGASVPRIVALFAKDFGALVLAGAAVAIPLAYGLAERWLDAFAYRIGLGPGPFVLAGGFALGLALLLVALQAFRAATADPVASLRSE